MGNHTHETGGIQLGENKKSYLCGIRELGNWMRRAHSRFGARYNRRHNRQGKVAYDRPKTSEIENEHQVLRVMFYGDVNPVRAGMVSHPSKYAFSSYKYYACGEKSIYAQHLTPPRGYLKLGKTSEARQRRYRQLCDEYMREAGLIADSPSEEMEARFIGAVAWREQRQPTVRECKHKRLRSPVVCRDKGDKFGVTEAHVSAWKVNFKPVGAEGKPISSEGGFEYGRSSEKVMTEKKVRHEV